MAKAQATALEKSESIQSDLVKKGIESTDEILKQFSEVNDEDLQELTEDYLEFKTETTYNMVFTGMSKFSGNNGEVEAVELVDEEGNKFINGNTVLVNSLKKAKQIPCLVRIVTGKMIKAKTGNNSYLDMQVFVLPKVTK